MFLLRSTLKVHFPRILQLRCLRLPVQSDHSVSLNQSLCLRYHAVIKHFKNMILCVLLLCIQVKMMFCDVTLSLYPHRASRNNICLGTVGIEPTPAQNSFNRVKPVFHWRIFTREATFFFSLNLILVPFGFSRKLKDQGKKSLRAKIFASGKPA